MYGGRHDQSKLGWPQVISRVNLRSRPAVLCYMCLKLTQTFICNAVILLRWRNQQRICVKPFLSDKTNTMNHIYLYWAGPPGHGCIWYISRPTASWRHWRLLPLCPWSIICMPLLRRTNSKQLYNLFGWNFHIYCIFLYNVAHNKHYMDTSQSMTLPLSSLLYIKALNS